MRPGIQGYGVVLSGEWLPTLQTKLVSSSSRFHSCLDLSTPEEPTLQPSAIASHTTSPESSVSRCRKVETRKLAINFIMFRTFESVRS